MTTTQTEKNYIAAYCDVIRCVCDVNAYVSSSHRRQLDSMEIELGESRCEALKDVARRRMGTA